MNIYKKLNKEQIKLLEETGKRIEDREYDETEIKQIQNIVAEYIFSKSKNEISKESNKYSDILNIIGN